jgi:predicted RNA-binding protein with TRAM domain
MNWEQRRGYDVAVEKDGNRAEPGFDRGACHGNQFGAANLSEYLHRICNVGDPGDGISNHKSFVVELVTGDTRSGSYPDCGIATADGRRDRSSRRRVANTHLTENQQVGVAACNRGASGIECSSEPRLIQGRLDP